MATDPVCGMTVSYDSRYRHMHDGQTYLFCARSVHNFGVTSKLCRRGYGTVTTPAAQGDVTYTRPMEIRQPAPGNL
jgi:Cu+-exporting ATPase